MRKLENLSKKRYQARLRQVFKFFLKFCFGLKSSPRGSFGAKPSATDVKNPKESKNKVQNPPKSLKKNVFSLFRNKKNLKTCLRRAQRFLLSNFWKNHVDAKPYLEKSRDNKEVSWTFTERAADKFSSFFLFSIFSVFGAFWRFLGVLGGFGPYFQTL